MIIDRIKSLLELCSTADTPFPPTDLYNEGWMLRLVLDWLHRNRDRGYHLSLPYPRDARWYCEALLPSAFFARPQRELGGLKRDPLAESRTHADGVIGQFTIGDVGKGDFALRKDARCFVVIEAKMFSPLTPGVTNASYYDQATRNVACMAEAARCAGAQLEQLNALGFYVVAPESQIDERVFSKLMTRDSIINKVKQRAAAYEGLKDEWRDRWFLPLAEKVELATVAWEKVIREISESDATFGQELNTFYANCLRFNKSASPAGRR